MNRKDIIVDNIKNKVKKVSPRVRVLQKATEIADVVLTKEEKYANMSMPELRKLSFKMMDEIKNGVPLDHFVIDALAIAREVIWRVHKLKAYKVQLIGAIVAHFGDFAEMKTGEGKTLVLLLVSYLNALSKKGVHIVTVNEYLVERDKNFSEKALGELGISVGFILSSMSPQAKKKMYACDITYASNSELGFDYLRDNMAQSMEEKMQRELNFAIVDEADSVLIDEARTPLIIAGNPDENLGKYIDADDFVKSLSPNDYVIDIETETVNLNDNGIKKAEEHFKLDNLYDIENSDIVHKVLNSLKANYIMEIGKQYIIRKNQEKGIDEIALVDVFTGRVMEGRMYSSGLHQAIQAKERVNIDPENVTVATITYQSFFRLYKKLAGVSGTALTEKNEFLNIYNMVVVDIPTNKPIARIDHPDYIFASKQAKWKYAVAEIKRRHELGQPILIGTVSVEDSELLHRLLDHIKIPHKVLNAKNHMIEAEIIKKAGEKGAVTIATNMAGRGTDIKLGEGVRELGGLFVLGTERNESRRIDNQLRGRSGRQGDPGESRFFISLQDSLFKRFASDKFDKAQYKLGEEMIDLKFFSRLLDRTQKRVEDLNFDARKSLIDYDYVLSEQRELIYKQRNNILISNDMLSIILRMVPKVVEVLVMANIDEENVNMINIAGLIKSIKQETSIELNVKPEDLDELPNKAIINFFINQISKILIEKYKSMPKDTANELWRQITIQVLDNKWTKFLDQIEKLKQGVHLRSYEQKSPLNIYVEDSDRLFYNITIDIAEEVIKLILKSDAQTSMPQSTKFSFFDNSNLVDSNSAAMGMIPDSDLLGLEDIPLSRQIDESKEIIEGETSMEDNKNKLTNNINDVVDEILKSASDSKPQPTMARDSVSVPPPIPSKPTEEVVEPIRVSAPPPIPQKPMNTQAPKEENDFLKQVMSAVDSIDTKELDFSDLEKMVDDEIKMEEKKEEKKVEATPPPIPRPQPAPAPAPAPFKAEPLTASPTPTPPPIPRPQPQPTPPRPQPMINDEPLKSTGRVGPSEDGKFYREDNIAPESYKHNLRIDKQSTNIFDIQKELDRKHIELIEERYQNIINVKDENIQNLIDRSTDLEKEIEEDKISYSKQIEDIYKSENDKLRGIKSQLEDLLLDKERMEKDLYQYRLKEMEAEQQKIADERDALEQERRKLEEERRKAEELAQLLKEQEEARAQAAQQRQRPMMGGSRPTYGRPANSIYPGRGNNSTRAVSISDAAHHKPNRAQPMRYQQPAPTQRHISLASLRENAK